MMWEANMPTKFWSEVIPTACYLHRRSPTISLSGNHSPFEVLFRTVPPIEHFRCFGCRALKHIPPAQRNEKKFGSRSNPSMMLGYIHNTMKIWRIWDFNSGKSGRAVECSSVVFDEQEDAFTSSSGEWVETVEFSDQSKEPEQVDEPQEVNEMTAMRTDSLGIVQDTDSKSNTPKILWSFSLSLPKEISHCHGWWPAVRYQCPSFNKWKRLLLTQSLVADRR